MVVFIRYENYAGRIWKIENNNGADPMADMTGVSVKNRGNLDRFWVFYALLRTL